MRLLLVCASLAMVFTMVLTHDEYTEADWIVPEPARGLPNLMRKVTSPEFVEADSNLAAGGSCPCINPNWPCYNNGKCSGGGAKHANVCVNHLGGQMCEFAACQMTDCSQCSADGLKCNTCEEGFILDANSCTTEDSFFAGNTVTVLDNTLIALSSAKIHKALADSYKNHQNGKMEAVELAAKAVNKELGDKFDLVIVFPSTNLPQSGYINMQVWLLLTLDIVSTLALLNLLSPSHSFYPVAYHFV